MLLVLLLARQNHITTFSPLIRLSLTFKGGLCSRIRMRAAWDAPRSLVNLAPLSFDVRERKRKEGNALSRCLFDGFAAPI